ncbi:327_t:CDS:2 [Acaulospora colombiana]|uniref:327_t:CDS:1 n=1 Tax=Acaulospora colombiana TaxID=27376 RepID=A0ACA9KDF7_9GLOM|nr:327_t:CDS:2 [Acaulospora colombiana]
MSSSTTTYQPTTTKTSSFNFEPQDSAIRSKSLVRNRDDDEVYEAYISGPIKGVAFYLFHPNELRNDHPIWHYFYLCTLIFASFVSLFVGPVIFGMLAAIGGVATPLALSLVGSGIGLLLGLVFGVVFSVVCIVALVRALGWVAQWVLDTLWFGGSDLMLITKEQILYLINNQD